MFSTCNIVAIKFFLSKFQDITLQYDTPSFEFDQSAKTLATWWLKLGIFALLASGLFSLLLVASRTPAVQDMIPWLDFFHTALVVHVNLSVVIWFIAFAGVLWVLNNHVTHLIWDKLILAITVIGTLLIVAAPFIADGHPLLNNYVPILQQDIFLTGLSIFGCGFVLLILRSLLNATVLRNKNLTAISVGIFFSTVTAAFAMLALGLSYLGTPATYEAEAYYELLFWGGGHTLQFTHSFLLIVAWLVLLQATGVKAKFSSKNISLLFALMFLPVLSVPFIYWMTDVPSAEHRMAFTELMRYGGLTSLPLGLMITLQVLFAPKVVQAAQRPLRAALYSSILLFATGGIIGFLIEGVNVVIPAHYHGSIVGVTLAFMGLTYYFLPRFGFNTPTGKLANMQAYVYASGQMMHILGLAWSGGYGVQRKTAGSAQGLDSLPEIVGMGMMGLGGLISIIGGVLFLVVVLKAMYSTEK
jgi:hypothetical protein